MTAPTYDAVNIGDELPALQLPPVTRTTLALFAGASGDHNPIHIDTDFARKSGMPDVFAQGMLGMAWLGRLLTQTREVRWSSSVLRLLRVVQVLEDVGSADARTLLAR